MIKDTNFIFGTHASRDSPDKNPENFIENGAWPWSCDPVNFRELNANSSKVAKDMDLKFWHARSQGQSRHDAKKNSKGGVTRVA